MKFILLLLTLASLVQAKDLYSIRPLSEQEILQTYTHLLVNACTYGDRDWKTASFDPTSGYWGDGVSSGNEGIRTIASMELACATILKYDDGLSESQRRDLFAKANAALRYMVGTHRTGNQKCMDGKPWGATPEFGAGSWQSGMWTGTLAFGSWLMWDKLDPGLQQGIERVVAWEDDILAARKPPNGLWLDTKAEENGWEVPPLVLGALMFPTHPHAAAWREGAIRYMMNTLCTDADTHDASIVDGKPMNQWVAGANIQPDFTLENHNIFHPSYVGCSSYFMTQAQMYFTYAHQPIPQAAGHHLLDVWRMFSTIILPWGETADPQGMDWELHGLPFINLYASLATHDHDRFAARMEQCSLQYLSEWQDMCGGSLALPGSRFGIARHAINAEQAAYGLLAHKVFGPAAPQMSPRQAAGQQAGVWEYPYVQFIAHRTLLKFASFSWKNRIMGLLMPIGEGHESNPDFTVPIADGFVGSFVLAPRGKSATTVTEHAWKKTSDGFETTGTVLLNGGRLKQTLRMISVGAQAVIYEDHVTALSNVTVRRELGLPIGIENDQLTGGTRTLSDQTGQTIFDWQKPRPTFGVAGSCANVDGRIGVITLAGSGMAYTQASKYSPGIAVYTDTLYGSYSDHVHQFKAGEEIAHRLAIFFVEVTPEQTAALAQSCKIETTPAGRVLHFQQPGGKNDEVLLP